MNTNIFRTKTWPMRVCLILLAALSFLFNPHFALAAGDCSPYKGQATINELYVGKSGRTDTNNKVEIYNNGNVASAVWKTWSVVIYSNRSGKTAQKRGPYPLNSGFANNGQFIYNNTTKIYLQNRDARWVDVALLDANGDFIDYIAIENKIQTVPACFGTTTTVQAFSNSDKSGDLPRNPDGGSWPASLTGTTGNTIGYSNACTAGGNDLLVSNSVDIPNPVRNTTTVTYSVGVQNKSCTGSVTGIQITDTNIAAANFSGLSFNHTQGSSVVSGNNRVWTVGTLAAGTAATMTITGVPLNPGNLDTSASVTVPSSGLINTDNDSETATITVRDFNYVSFDADTATITEGLDTAFKAGISSDVKANHPITVNYTITGTAGSGDRTFTTTSPVTINPTDPDDPQTTSIDFNITNDAVSESPKTIVLTINSVTSSDAAVRLDTGANVMTITLNDDDLPQPIAEYRFDECPWTSGSTGAVTDSVGSYQGTPYNVTTTSGGVVQRAADLNASGITDFIQWPVSLLHGRTNFTLLLWFKTSINQAQQEILHGLGADAGDDEIELYLINDKTIRFNILDNGNDYTAASAFNDGNWHHLAVTRSGTSVCVYLDAALLGCNTQSNTAISIPTANALLSGQEQDSYGGSFADNQSLRAQLDEFKVFNNALNSGQIATIRTNELAGKNWDGTARPATCLPNCFSDNFTGNNGDSPASNWSMTTSSGSFGLPRIMNNRLRLTDASINVTTAAHLQKLFPGAGNKIVVEFDYFASSGTGADGAALIFSDASITPQSGAYGGSLGYAQKTGINGFAGGWLGIGIDEYGNFSNPTEGRSGGPGFRADSVAVRGSGSSTTGYVYHAGTGTLTPGVDQAGAAHRYRISIDHSNNSNAFVTVERDTTGSGSNYATIIPQYDAKTQSGQAAVPTNWLLSLTGSTGSSTNIHEIDNLKVCTTQPIIDVAGPHHIRIEHTGSGVTCAPSTLTIKACADAACTTLYTGGVTGALTALIASGTPTVNWLGGAGFSIDATGSTTKQVQVTTAGTVNWGTNGESPVPANNTSCTISGTASCSFTSALAGFLINVPNHYSDVPQTITVSAVKQADNSLACTPAFASTSKTINFGCGYSDPATGTLPVTVGSSSITCGSTSSVSLSFGATGTATTTVRYADVGQMNLTASYNGSSGSETGLFMTGGDPFIVAPSSFTVVPSGPYVAGTPFSVTVTAKNALGGTTANFGKESSTENVSLTHTLTLPAGGYNPALTDATLADATFSNGVANASNIKWAEVGNISLTATLASASYLSSGLPSTGGPAATGPFRPAYFDTAVTPGTNTFTYSGQPFTVKVTAKNALGGTTANYAGDHARNVTLADANSGSNCSTSTCGGTTVALGAFSNNTVAATSFISYASNPTNAGTATISTISYAFDERQTAPLETRLAPLPVPSTPQSTLNGSATSSPVKIQATDTDNVSSSGHTEGSTDIRSGRVRMANAYGSERLVLPVMAQAEYYSTTGWILNTADTGSSATALSAAPTVTVTGGITTSANCPPPTACTTSSRFSGGLLDLRMTPPNAPGYADITLNVPAWLEYPWRSGTSADPSSRATFGIYKGNNRIIYRRERY